MFCELDHPRRRAAAVDLRRQVTTYRAPRREAIERLALFAQRQAAKAGPPIAFARRDLDVSAIAALSRNWCRQLSF